MKREWRWHEDGFEVFRSVARTGPGCHEGCGVLLFVKEGKLVKVEGDPDFPLSQGRLCPRCLALPQVVYHPNRLKYPLRRTGQRGEGKWQRIDWEEAYGTIAGQFDRVKKQHGAESVIFCQGTGRDIRPYITKLAYSFGSPNKVTFGPLHGHACFAPKVTTLRATTGSFQVADCAQFFADRYQNSEWRPPRLILIWGNNPVVSNSDGFLGHWVIESMKRGSEIIVIDPRKTWLASRAKIWLQIRPGTDAALSLGMLNVIINEGLYDENFVTKWTYGFEELKARVQEYPPEKVSEITWIPADLIVAAARKYAATKPAAIQWGVSIDQSRECVPTIHAIMCLWALTGNLDSPGGNVIKNTNFKLEGHINTEFQAIGNEQKKKKIGAGRYPLLDYWYLPAVGSVVIDQMDSGKPYPIKAAWIQTTNTFACGAADAKRVYEAFKRLDFVAVVDLFMTPTAMAFADIVLPAATYAERDGIALTGGNSIFAATVNKAIDPVGESKSDMQINLELGKRLNPQAWRWNTVREMFDEMLKPLGSTFEALRETGFAIESFGYKKHEKGLLRPDQRPGFDTPTGKVELYSTVFAECGLDPLPYFEEPPESPFSTPALAKEYPLILTTGSKTWGFFHSEHRQIPLLRSLNPDPLTEIHPDTAAKLGIKDGDWIYIENRYGRCQQRAKITEAIDPRVVNSQHGWWFPEKSGPEPDLYGAWDANINQLLPSDWVGRSGFGYPFKCQLCRVYKKKDV